MLKRYLAMFGKLTRSQRAFRLQVLRDDVADASTPAGRRRLWQLGLYFTLSNGVKTPQGGDKIQLCFPSPRFALQGGCLGY